MTAIAKNDAPCALIIDDEESIGDSLAGVLEDEGWTSRVALSGKAGIVEFSKSLPDVVFLDVWMPGMDGIETLQSLKGIASQVPVVIMSGHATIETAVKTTKLGAMEFLEKPLSIEKVLPILEKALLAKDEPSGDFNPEIVGISEILGEIKSQIEKVGPKDVGILITGENGTGKEVVAMNIHAKSPRHGNRFVAINCAAIPDGLIESELFGHAKGAFTGAVANQKGKFELADGGTLFLDEIGDMALNIQAKILRVLQEQVYERLGEEKTREANVRVIAATNKNLEEEIEAGNFREDLYYRLNVIPFHLPPLRERTEDIPVLAGYFLKQAADKLKEPLKYFSETAVEALQKYRWPGNIRELRNLIDRLTIMVSKECIDVEDLPSVITKDKSINFESGLHIGTDVTLKEAKSDFEKTFILGKLQENQWNISKTANAIGIERSNLHRKLRLYRIDLKELKE